MNNNQRFFNSFKKLEQLIRKKYQIANDFDSIAPLFRERSELKKHKNEFYKLKNIRNIIGHNADTLSITLFSVKDKTIERLESLLSSIEESTSVFSVCVKYEEILSANLNDSLLEKLKIMQSKKFNTIPVIENKKIVGIFSEDTLLRYLIDNEIILIDSSLRFKDIDKYLVVNENKLRYRFISKSLSIKSLYEQYTTDFENQVNIKAYFITHSGNQKEKVLGLITPYRIATYNFH